jgi:hypothetical protein
MFVVFRPLIARLAIDGELSRVQRFVAQVLKSRAVVLIRAGLRSDDDLPSSGVAIFRRIGGCHDAKLADHVRCHAEIIEGHHAAL